MARRRSNKLRGSTGIRPRPIGQGGDVDVHSICYGICGPNVQGGGCEQGNMIWCDCGDQLPYPGTNSGVPCDGGGDCTNACDAYGGTTCWPNNGAIPTVDTCGFCCDDSQTLPDLPPCITFEDLCLNNECRAPGYACANDGDCCMKAFNDCDNPEDCVCDMSTNTCYWRGVKKFPKQRMRRGGPLGSNRAINK